jgi:hypothetical protein
MTEQKRISAKQVQEDLTNKLDKVVESTNEAVNGVNDRIDGIEEGLGKILEAVNKPVVKRDHFEPLEQDLGGEHSREFDEDGVLELPQNANPESAEFQTKAAALAFNEEPVTVFIHDTSEKNADPIFEVAVNGRKRTFLRDKEYTVPRKFVEALARARPIAYKNEEYTRPDGERAVRYNSSKGLRYGFSVVRDDNPNGKAWLKGVLAEP